MCQHCSTQTHSSPDGDRQGVAFTPFQYKQHIKSLKSTIAPKSLPNIPTSASGSECLQILSDQIIPADYLQLTQGTFSTPEGLNSTAHKPYSGSQNLPPQELEMIISAILSLRYNIPHRASCIFNPTLNLLIKSSISSSAGHPTPAFHIPQDLSTIFEHLQLEPVIQDYICCPQCFFLNGLTESVTTDQPHCQCHNYPNDHDSPCTQSLGKLIYSFEPRTQNTTNTKQNFIPTKHFIYQPFKNWLARFLQWAGIIEILHPHQQSQTPEGSPKCEIWDGLVWRRFTGTTNSHHPPFMSIPGALAFSIYVDWFNAHVKSTRLAGIGPIMLIFLNLLSGERLKPENVYVSGIIPGSKEKTELPINATHQGAQRAMARLPFFTHLNSHKSTISRGLWATPKQQQAIFSKYGVRYSILEDLQYWDASRMVNLDIMHNSILGILKDHAAFKLCIPESKSKIYFRSHRKSNDTNSSDSDSMTSNSSLDQITLREARSLRRDTAKIINESLPTPHTQHPSSASAEIPSFNANYIPTSKIPSELDISALSDHQIKGEALEHL
ncbi:hypothetical protein O181_033469 [Austropuccinia psidii MF-1]|uniref:Uncharacterized protein n=1 Tax=Austropuccinia psidii MF-1 TaxID=1389203 RepID=A0A9Q3CYU3_9BASI|nr:hypothetical protein [Austropuccinia psidii MF-1]